MKCPNCNHEWQFSGVRSKIEESVFRAAVEAAHGNVSQAARDLGMKTITAGVYARRLGINRTFNKHRPWLTNDMILDAYKTHKNIDIAAESLDIPESTFFSRLRDIAEYREMRRAKKNTKSQARSLEVARAMVESNGNMAGAAVLLGLSRERVRQLWNKSRDNQ
ncbi:hypothetical protein LCGC14_1906470 [marine sediment metagenome]|uniref:Uncharacterized protein n=1 Tax=marine sediment metagenome TaxID=412755 RepID=A0A0F9I8Y3_9ZZZZ